MLYGQTGAGGIVNLVSRRPTEAPIHEFRFEGGSFGRIQTGIDLSGKLNESGTVLGRITGIVRDADTQYDFIRERRVAIAPALTIRPSENTTLTLLANYQNDPLGGFYNFVPATGTVIDSRLGKIHSNFFGGDPNYDQFKREQASIGYQFEHRFNDVFTIRQNYRFQHIETDFRALSIQSIATNGRTANRIATSSFDFANTSALDNQVQATFDTGALHHTVLAGLEWDRGEASRKLATQTAGVPTLDLFAPVYFRNFAITPINPETATTEQSQDQLGVYLQDQVAVGKLRLNAAVRQDRALSSTFTRSTSARVDQDNSATTWRIGALYLFDSGLAPYASYSTSFLPNAGTGAPQRGSTPFTPTTGDQYEVGVKFQPPGSNSFVQLAGFQITQQNVLTRDRPIRCSRSRRARSARAGSNWRPGRACLTMSA